MWLETTVAGLGAFLLFLVQPWIGKQLLPWWGGSYATWAITMAFFQVTVLGGYLLAHLAFAGGPTRLRLSGLAAALVASVFFVFRNLQLPLATLEAVPPTLASQWWFLASFLGVPVVLLAMTSPTLQTWHASRSGPGTEIPWSLYAASNAGSFAGLLGYCWILEPFFATQEIWQIWSTGYLVWAVLLLAAAPWRANASKPQQPGTPWTLRSDWIMPALAGSATLTAITNALTQDVPPIPQVWTIALAVYLTSYILVFKPGWFNLFAWMQRAHWILAFCLAVTVAVHWQLNLGAVVQSALLLAFLFGANVLAHGALVWRAPEDPTQITRFYLAIALGGALGSSLMAFCAPVVFTGLGELALVLVLTAAAVWNQTPWRRDRSDPLVTGRIVGAVLIFGILPAALVPFYPHTLPFIYVAMLAMMVYGFVMMAQLAEVGRNQALVLLIVAGCFWIQDALIVPGNLRLAARTYYGLYRVFDRDDVRYLRVGSVFHGHEILAGADRRKPLFYYHEKTPIGSFFARPEATWTRAGIVGLGAGVLAAYGRTGQAIDFYELDPTVVSIARTHFSYLASATASVSCIIGDGRLQLRRQPSHTYDILLLDCFNSDAVPVHLLTRDAIKEYVRVIRADGIALFHVSNSTFNLAPLVHAAARDLGLISRQAQNPAETTPRAATTRWVALGTPAGIERHLGNLVNWREPEARALLLPAWTDQHSSLLSVWPPDLSLLVASRSALTAKPLDD